MPSRLHARSRSFWEPRIFGVWNGAIAPSASERDGSGTTRARSIACTRPKPWQFGHAPSGLLNENSAGSGVGKRRPHPSQAKPSR